MEWLTVLQYVPQTITLCKGTRDAVVAWKKGNKTEAIHAAIGGIKPFLVGAVGLNLGAEFSKAVGLSSHIANGLISSAAGATVDCAVSAVTEKPFGLVKNVKDENYYVAIGSVVADFGYGVRLADE